MDQQNDPKPVADATTQEQAQAMPVALNSARMKSSYANVFQTRYTSQEILLSCGIGQPETVPDEDGRQKNVLSVEMNQRIVMTPLTAKRLAAALAQTVRKYEATYGVITAQ